MELAGHFETFGGRPEGGDFLEFGFEGDAAGFGFFWDESDFGLSGVGGVDGLGRLSCIHGNECGSGGWTWAVQGEALDEELIHN